MRNTKMDMVIKHVAEYFQVDVNDLTGERKLREFVIPRQMSIYLIYHQVLPSKSAIARYFGLDHTTVIHSIRSIEDKMDMKNHRELLMKSVKRELSKMVVT